MKAWMLVVAIMFLFSCRKGTEYELPAEWEPHEAVWVGLHHKSGRDSVSAAIVKAIYPHVTVRLNYHADSTRRQFSRLFHGMGVDTSRLEWIKDSVSFPWMRDPGPLFVRNEAGQCKVIDYHWINYGYLYLPKSTIRLDKQDTLCGKIDERMAKRLHLPVIHSSFVAEGGGLESNGQGVLMTIEETALQRNPGKKLQEIEAEYRRTTGSKKVIWLKRMTLHDKNFIGLSTENWVSGGANGHIDEVARFIDAHTIVLAKIDEAERSAHPISRVDAEILEENYATLRNATDADGKPFTIVRFPYPDLNVYALKYVVNDSVRNDFDVPLPLKNGDTLKFAPAVGYMNFTVTNGVVLTAAYWRKGLPLREKQKDDEVKRLLHKYYPGRKVVQLNPYAINRGGGGIHCTTQPQPKRRE